MRSAPLLLAALALPARAALKEIWWNITYVENANPDGLFERQVIGVNGTWPPPPVDVSTNDTLLVHAHNSLNEPTSLHHHGMYFNSTSWMDGAVGVSQWCIPPGDTFDYVVPVNESGQWGSYWVHAHASGQYVDGLRAPLVIHPEKEAHSYDAEYTVVLGDWYHDQHSTLLDQFISISNPGGAEPVPDAPLIYFAQNGAYLAPAPGTSPSGSTSAVGFNENATLAFEPGKTYRLRVVNTAAFAMFFFWIDGHDMRIIEADGTDIEEYPIDLISVTVAQRYSVLVTARNDTNVTNWAIHANMDTDMFDTVPDTLNPNATAFITYSASAPLTDLGTIDAYSDVPDIDLVPLTVEAMPPVDETYELEVTFDTMDDGTNHAMFNQVTYNAPLVPTILSERTLAENATVAEAYGPNHIVVDHLKVFDIVVQNGDAGKHPFHLHGHKMQIVGRSEDYTSDNATLNPPIVEGQKNPMRRDTVQVPSGTSVTLRVIADNPGAWFFHCHIEWHLEVGLAVTFLEAPALVQQRGSVPPYLTSQCQQLGMPISGNAAGHASTTDLSGLTVGPFPQRNGWHSKGIGAMAGCVLAAVLGMASVVWYARGEQLSEEEVEEETRRKVEEKRRRGRFWGLGKKRE
ncbi:Fet3 ferroxidase [Heterobasidion irregulare TC 32-1]|uniref:Fet3 ferroxidase n=1 Tax=Heterobasidion irregulare (strain TC 32-1) TaxID=747525 RepID=W4JSF6_HETIT|nr:Fet3 ferroxidase [Heterobasidion irregulare TC 32-1]ETW75786.1 Fet3 ferroxidase [Heterobasidion irregulare TC 32-1]